MKMYQKGILLISLIGLMAACATSTQLRKSWSDPSLTNTPVKPFNKVFIMVTLKNDASRRAAEDQLAEGIRNGSTVKSYTYLTPADTSQKLLVEKLKKEGFDGAITMRLKSVVQTRTTSPGTPYGNWYTSSYVYGYGYSYVATYVPNNSGNSGPTTVDINSPKDYIVETNIYSLESSKLLWSGVTASLKPKKLDQAMSGIINTIRLELQKKGFIKK